MEPPSPYLRGVSSTLLEVDHAHRSLTELMTAYARDEPVRSVAVVGNAPLAPDPVRARAIDDADLVIRMNSFVMDVPSGPACQGSRVDVVVWNRITRATEFVFHDYRDRLYVLVEPMRLHGNPEMWPTSWPDDLGLVPGGSGAPDRPGVAAPAFLDRLRAGAVPAVTEAGPGAQPLPGPGGGGIRADAAPAGLMRALRRLLHVVRRLLGTDAVHDLSLIHI